MSVRQWVKLVVAIVIVVAVLVLLVVNPQRAVFKPFFPEPGIPVSVFIILTTGVGFIGGMLVASFWITIRTKSRERKRE